MPEQAPQHAPAKEKLGLLRFWQVYFFGVVGLSLVALMFISGSQSVFSADDYVSFGDIVFSALASWLILQRKQLARPFISLGSLLIIIIGITCDLIANHGVISISLVLGHNRGILLLAALYFWFSRRVRQTLNQPFVLASHESPAHASKDLYNLREFSFWRNLAIYFMVFSVIGHLMERVYSTFTRYFMGIYDPLAPLWQDYLSPFNIYGFGAVVCILALFPIKQFLQAKIKVIWLVLPLSFIINTVVVTAIELTVGLATNHPDTSGHLIYWDYSNLPFNFMGQICLQNALGFGLVATVMVWVIFPSTELFFLCRSTDTMNLVFVFVLVGYLLLTATYLIDLTLPQPLRTDLSNSGAPTDLLAQG
ncbi:MAG: putative ABC transporter permease [Coriobacteriales bacterium]|nr:putative ABC transporter permease [Coriobacteriales bacterium]